jgi:hypothetical protein
VERDLSSDDSEEENDIVPPIKVIPFRQVDYLWLFNPFTHFDQRQDFVLQDSSLSLADYSQMRYINRHLLTHFMSNRLEKGIVQASVSFSEVHIDE